VDCSKSDALDACLSEHDKKRAPVSDTRFIDWLADIVPSLTLPDSCRNELRKQWLTLCRRLHRAVRSSAADEDGLHRSFAGQLDSFLGVREDEIADKVALVWGSAFQSRNMQYRQMHGLEDGDMCCSGVIIQKMVNATAAV